MRWANFSIWRARLPHWRADGVTYYVTFRHRRPLDERERDFLLANLTKSHGRRWDHLVVCVLPEATEMIFTVREDPSGEPYEPSDILEKAKTRAGKDIIKRSGERFPPFYTESYDRILRDDAELEETFERILQSPVQSELAESPDEYSWLWVPELA